MRSCEDAGYRLVAPTRTWRYMRQPLASRAGVAAAENLAVELGVPEHIENGGIRAELDWRGRRIAVYNVHLAGYTTGRPGTAGWRWSELPDLLRKSILQRAAEATALRKRLVAEELPFLVCGDLNTTVNQWAYRHITRDLTDAHRATGRLARATFPARTPLVRIDYVLASPAWRVLSSRVLPPLGSDHRAVVVVLKIE